MTGLINTGAPGAIDSRSTYSDMFPMDMLIIDQETQTFSLKDGWMFNAPQEIIVWTPEIGGSTSNPTGISYSSKVGTGMLEGKKVTLWFSLNGTITGAGSGRVAIAGLPFTVAPNCYYAVASLRTSYLPVTTVFHADPGGTRLLASKVITGGSTTLSWGDTDVSATNFGILGTITYFIA